MSRLGDFDISQLLDLLGRFKQLNLNAPLILEDCIKELAARLYAKTVARTPVDSGDLRRGWQIGQVVRNGDSFEVGIINPVEYAPYVEHGHRTKNHMGWVEGRFMLTISVDELEKELPAILERKFEDYIKRHLRW
ncbi:HK97 gp10 family phage protein [Paenibacillus ferrarius]|uniref:HK97 gp10 family phage protein n=1 Tax=Paenibacillus ferrarius TaxID=1469647 RepID=UPI003D280F98